MRVWNSGGELGKQMKISSYMAVGIWARGKKLILVFETMKILQIFISSRAENASVVASLVSISMRLEYK